MKAGVLISCGIAAAAAIGLTVVFVNNASPYLKIGELQAQSKGVHVVGQIVPTTLKQDLLKGRVLFELKDETGKIPVVYTGPPISNLSSATQVVVIGSYEDEAFKAKQMLVKCPSKYESEKGAKPDKSS